MEKKSDGGTETKIGTLSVKYRDCINHYWQILFTNASDSIH